MAGKLVGRSISNTANVTIQSITVGNSSSNTTANSTAVAIGNVVFTDSRISVGNSTVNAAINSTSVSTLSVTVGSNVTVNTSTIFIGNSTVNTSIASATILINGVNVNTAITANASAAYSNAIAYSGNSALAFANAALRADAAYSNAIAYSGNSAAAYTNAIAYSSNATNISSGTLDTARLPATVNVSTAIYVGSNVAVNTSTISIGNSTVNTSIASATILINGVNVNTAITANADAAYSNAIAYSGNSALAFANAALRADAAYSNAIAYSGNSALAFANAALRADAAYSNATSYSSNATNISSGTLAFARLPALYLGTTTIQSTSAAQAVSGVTTLTTGNTTITGFANVTSTIQGGGALTIAGAASGITTLAAGNTTIAGFANVTSTIQGGAGLIVAGAVSGITTLAASGNVVISGTSTTIGNYLTNFSSTGTASGDGLCELFRVAATSLCTGGIFSVAATRGSYVTTGMFSWSSTHNGAGQGVITQLSTGSYSTFIVSVDVAVAGDVIICANFGASQAYAITVIKLMGSTIDYSNAGTSRVSAVAGYTRYSRTTTDLGFRTQNGIFDGSLSKGSGSFLIQHPLHELEETHNLVHSFIEGPQADLIYRGKVTLAAGCAEVNIDTAAKMTEGTFEVLCRDVQCFTTNETDWSAVRGYVIGNILHIECQSNTSTATISWMVIGERKDKHMYDTGWTDKDGRPIVEPLKNQVQTEFPPYPE